MSTPCIFLALAGGFAYVFLVQDAQSGVYYALKRLIVPDKERMKVTQQEIDIMVCANAHQWTQLAKLMYSSLHNANHAVETLALFLAILMIR